MCMHERFPVQFVAVRVIYTLRKSVHSQNHTHHPRVTQLTSMKPSMVAQKKTDAGCWAKTALKTGTPVESVNAPIDVAGH